MYSALGVVCRWLRTHRDSTACIYSLLCGMELFFSVRRLRTFIISESNELVRVLRVVISADPFKLNMASMPARLTFISDIQDTSDAHSPPSLLRQSRTIF